MRAWVKPTLLFSLLSSVALDVRAADRGIIGITIVGEPDFRVVESVLAGSPAYLAGIRAGDHILAIGDYPTAKLQTVGEFLSRVSGPPGSEVELQLKRSEAEPVRKIKLRRIAPVESRKIPADFNRYQARAGTTRLIKWG